MATANMTINRWRMGVPVATPVTPCDCLAALSALARPARAQSLERQVEDLLRVTFVRGANLGRTALFLSLKAIGRISSRTEVVVPAFICPSVGRAVIKAGLTPVLCDVGPGGSGLDVASLEKVLGRNTLAVVTAHLYGYPCDIEPLLELSHSAGAMVVEDAAQAFGAKYRGRYLGTTADVGIFSFGMSKVLWSMGGGLVATSNSELVTFIDEEISSLPRPNRLEQAADIAKFAALSLIVRSHHLGPLDAIWSKSMRGKGDCNDFHASVCPPSHAAVATGLIARLAEITRVREQNAAYFSDNLTGLDGIVLPNADSESTPVFLRFPVIVHDPAAKNSLLFHLRRAGINVSEMYTRESYEALKMFTARDSRCPRAEYLAERMLNLPTHPYMRARDLRACVDVFHSVLGRKRVFKQQGSRKAAAVH